MNSGATFFGRDRRLSGLRWCSPPPPQRSCPLPARVAAQERGIGACFSCFGGRVGPGAPGACRKRCGALCFGLSGCEGGGWSCLQRISTMESTSVGVPPCQSRPASAPAAGAGVREPQGGGEHVVYSSGGIFGAETGCHVCADDIQFCHYGIVGRIAQCRWQLPAGRNWCSGHRRDLPA